jgi:hypothetical protein
MVSLGRARTRCVYKVLQDAGFSTHKAEAVGLCSTATGCLTVAYEVDNDGFVRAA